MRALRLPNYDDDDDDDKNNNNDDDDDNNNDDGDNNFFFQCFFSKKILKKKILSSKPGHWKLEIYLIFLSLWLYEQGFALEQYCTTAGRQSD